MTRFHYGNRIRPVTMAVLPHSLLTLEDKTSLPCPRGPGQLSVGWAPDVIPVAKDDITFILSFHGVFSRFIRWKKCARWTLIRFQPTPSHCHSGTKPHNKYNNNNNKLVSNFQMLVQCELVNTISAWRYQLMELLLLVFVRMGYSRLLVL